MQDSTTSNQANGNFEHFLGLKNKILLPVAAIVIITAMLLTIQATSRIRTLIYDGLEGKAKTLGSSLATNAEQTMLTQDLASIAGDIDNQIKSIVYNNKRAMDVAVPLMSGALGTAHIGMDLDHAQAQISSLTWSAVITTLLAVAIGLALLSWILGRIISPIRDLTGIVQRIVEEGDLTQKITIHSQDEVGKLARYFERMVERLREIPLAMEQNVKLLEEAVGSMEMSTSNQSDSINQQATALQQTQVTAQEIKQTSQVAAQSAADILKSTEKADALGRTGEEAVDKSLKGMMDIQDQSEQIAQRINELNERTRQISGITDTVKDLADQSNMLALNAAIEAVRSGEHGKGFSLVAREIRRLADQSIQATNQVQSILENTTEATNQAVRITEKGHQKMESGLSDIKSSGDNLKQLADMVKENSAAVRQIATAVNQQNSGISQIFTAVTDQSAMMDDAVRGLDQVQGNVEVLKNVSKSLSDVIGRYKV